MGTGGGRASPREQGLPERAVHPEVWPLSIGPLLAAAGTASQPLPPDRSHPAAEMTPGSRSAHRRPGSCPAENTHTHKHTHTHTQFFPLKFSVSYSNLACLPSSQSVCLKRNLFVCVCVCECVSLLTMCVPGLSPQWEGPEKSLSNSLVSPLLLLATLPLPSATPLVAPFSPGAPWEEEEDSPM